MLSAKLGFELAVFCGVDLQNIIKNAQRKALLNLTEIPKQCKARRAERNQCLSQSTSENQIRLN